MAARKWTTAEIEELLLAKYSMPKYACWTQVPNATGWSKNRTCDALAIGCWQSVGIELTGFEIKVSRSDWQKEMQDPHKAESFSRHCNRWYLLAPKEVAKLDELPDRWGFMYPTHKGNLRVGRPAALVKEPEPIQMEMLAGMLRSALSSNRDREAQEAAVQKAYSEGFAEGCKREKDMNKELQRCETLRNDRLRERLEEFEKRSGVRIDDWRLGDIAAHVRLLSEIGNLDTEKIIDGARKLISSAEKLAPLVSDPVDGV